MEGAFLAEVGALQENNPGARKTDVLPEFQVLFEDICAEKAMGAICRNGRSVRDPDGFRRELGNPGPVEVGLTQAVVPQPGEIYECPGLGRVGVRNGLRWCR